METNSNTCIIYPYFFVKIRPIQYGNTTHATFLDFIVFTSQLKSDRYSMETMYSGGSAGDIVVALLKSDRYSMETSTISTLSSFFMLND